MTRCGSRDRESGEFGGVGHNRISASRRAAESCEGIAADWTSNDGWQGVPERGSNPWLSTDRLSLA